MIWIVNTGAKEIPCPRPGCPPIKRGEEHVDVSRGHIIRPYKAPLAGERSAT